MSNPEPGSDAEDLDPQVDDWLIGRARSGDPEAWEVLIRRHRRRIYRIALRMLGDPHDAEDVAQDVILQLLTALSGFTGGSTFTTWLYRIVINRCINHQQRRRINEPLDDLDPTAPGSGPEQIALARDRLAATGRALAELPVEQRSALVLHEIEGLSYEQVATILKVGEPTVRGRIYRARRRLIRQIQEWS